MASRCEHDRNNKIPLQIKQENKGHPKLDVEALQGPKQLGVPLAGSWQGYQPGTIPPPQTGAGQPGEPGQPRAPPQGWAKARLGHGPAAMGWVSDPVMGTRSDRARPDSTLGEPDTQWKHATFTKMRSPITHEATTLKVNKKAQPKTKTRTWKKKKN